MRTKIKTISSEGKNASLEKFDMGDWEAGTFDLPLLEWCGFGGEGGRLAVYDGCQWCCRSGRWDGDGLTGENGASGRGSRGEGVCLAVDYGGE